MKLRNIVRKYGPAAGVAALASVQTAHAALPESVETAVTAVTADVTEAGGLMIGIVLAVLAIRKVISMLR